MSGCIAHVACWALLCGCLDKPLGSSTTGCCPCRGLGCNLTAEQARWRHHLADCQETALPEQSLSAAASSCNLHSGCSAWPSTAGWASHIEHSLLCDSILLESAPSRPSCTAGEPACSCNKDSSSLEGFQTAGSLQRAEACCCDNSAGSARALCHKAVDSPGSTPSGGAGMCRPTILKTRPLGSILARHFGQTPCTQ